ncbi:ABC transporter permease [Pseudoteredinibacter isoporae]|uniref:ABC-2 type transport system permease protein n=1 Tax=Pseudoteredinibacter isoporae TaxID=570281 RepID=A0A7X0JWJ0_9GAMM|nr:DUF3526 domain-containing protein [Pseudoteredinibacter isoporae]MBB6523028.1 ABC-2 type transport system permease protein [Pseudoteredinibacter isoporae]NHO88550.1 DUF3526 domain-containing protein [Pseudoteredinibacter isoporae]NIB22759.1 DUF3526 domain-containing protein [Pseudoteredinibacter isoporae]
MKVITQIMLDEWRYWLRSKLGITVLAITLVITIAAVIVNAMEMRQAAEERQTLQKTAEARFLEQPDRHPHRMVHYGHYVFRAPSPLSIVEPGVDAYTGTSIFLEGHRQNSAMFAEQRQSSGMTRFSSLSPSFLMQVLAPLFILLIGYASMTREREAGTLSIMVLQGLSRWHLLLGKLLALMGAGLVILLPLSIASIGAALQGESALVSAGFILGYFLYLLVWSALVLAVSTMSSKSNSSFAVSLGIWLLLCILIPRIGSSVAATVEPSLGKLESDFAVLEALRKLGDGHNAADPAFEQLKKNLLAQYDAESVDELPVNFRGVVAEYSEKKLTNVLNQFAEARMEEERSQANVLRNFGWLSPTIAVRSLSMMMAGTNVETHHRFLRDAETLRFDFVQSLNQIHRDHLDYKTDMARSKSKASSLAARVSSDNWSVLSEFEFKPEPGTQRLENSLPYIAQLLLWCVLVMVMLKYTMRRVQ